MSGALWLAGAGGAVTAGGLVALSRSKRGLPVFRPSFPDSLFDENWVTGGRGLVTANTCAWVSLLPGRLVTGLHFPFNLTLPGGLLRWAGLANDISYADLVALDPVGSSWSRRLEVTYRLPSGQQVLFWLKLREPDVIHAAFEAARRRV